MPTSSTRNIALRLGAVAVGMFGFGFALVPIYDVMCKVLGVSRETINTQAQITPGSSAADVTRTVTIQFLANNDGGMSWDFRPQQFEMRVNPGSIANTSYYVRNPAHRTMVAQAIPSVSPPEAAPFLHKTECFCFRQQPLNAGDERDMPLQFVIDQALPDDIRTITLSYTLFDVTGSVAAADKRVGAAN
jgi:cytochrome c oxidase assembly protein subunit 11